MSDPGTRYEAAAERRAWILATLRTARFLSIADLARDLQVSQMTIRRDLHTLESSGEVRMVHGGASLSPSAVRNSVFPDDVHTEARDRVARYAAELVDETDTIVIDAGPTAYALAQALPEDFDGCVITHSMPVLQLLVDRRPATRVVALGGELLVGRRAFVGPTTEAAVAQLRARIFFLSPSAVDARGAYAESAAEASVQRGLMGIADEVVIVSTHEAFARSAPARVAPLDRLAALVVDHRPSPLVLEALGRGGGVPHIVDERRPGTGTQQKSMIATT